MSGPPVWLHFVALEISQSQWQVVTCWPSWSRGSLSSSVKRKDAYGKGCPWSCSFYGKSTEYRGEDYPNAVSAIERTIALLGTMPPNGRELMDCYIEAVHRVFDNLDVVLELEIED